MAEQKPIPILYFSSSTSPQGGAELRLLQMVLLVQKTSRFSPHVVLPTNDGTIAAYRDAGIPVHVLPLKRLRLKWSPVYWLSYSWSLPRTTIGLMALIDRWKIALVHTNEIIDLHGLLAGRLMRKAVVAHVRVVLERPRVLAFLLKKFVCRMASHVVGVSNAVRESLLPREGSCQKISVLYDPAPVLSGCVPREEERVQRFRDAHDLSSDDFVIGMIGKFVRQKGHESFLGVADRLKRRGFNSFRFVIVGGQVEGHEKYYKNMCNLITALDLETQMRLAGYQQDIAAALDGMDVFVHLPEEGEAMGAAVMEAMVMEKPVVTFACGAVPEFVRNEETGYLIETGNLDAVAEKIIILYRDSSRRREVGTRARAYILQNFSPERYRDRLLDLYDSLLASRDGQ